MSKLEEIKDCPFCGNGNPNCDLAPGGWIVECSDCPANYDRQETKSAAIAGWNRRAALESAEPTICAGEAWLACGGNPDPECVASAKKDDVLALMRIHAEIADEQYALESAEPVARRATLIAAVDNDSGCVVLLDQFTRDIKFYAADGKMSIQRRGKECAECVVSSLALAQAVAVAHNKTFASPPPESAALEALRELHSVKDAFNKPEGMQNLVALTSRLNAAWEAARAVVEGKSNG